MSHEVVISSSSAPTLAQVVDLFTPAAACAVVPATAFFPADDGTTAVSYDVNSIVQTAKRKRVVVTPTVTGATVTTLQGVALINNAAAVAITLATPAACDPTDLWIKASSGSQTAGIITITPASGTIENQTSINFAGVQAGVTNAGPNIHLVFDGTNWWEIGR